MTDRGAITDVLLALLAGLELRAEAPDLDRPWRGLGLDSLDIVEVLAAAEEQIGIDIPDAVALRARTPRQLIDWLELELVG